MVAALANARDFPTDRAEDLVDDALATGPLVEEPDAGTYGALRLATDDEPAETTPPEGDSPRSNPGGSADKSPANDADPDTAPDDREINQQDGPEDADVLVKNAPAIDAGVFPEDALDTEQWLTWKATADGRKVSRAPYVNPE